MNSLLADTAFPQQPPMLGGSARIPSLAAQIAAVRFQHIEGVQEHVGRALAAEHGAHAVEVRHAVRRTWP